MMMVVYDNEALRSAHFDIGVSCSSFFFICLLMQLYYYRPFSPPSDYDPSHRHIHHGQNAFITFDVCLCIGFCIVCVRSLTLFLSLFPSLVLSALSSLNQNNEITFTPNKKHSHIVAMHSNLCVEFDEDRNMRRFHTWHRFQRKWAFNDRYIVTLSTPLSAPIALKINIQSLIWHFIYEILSVVPLAMEINSM